MIERYVVVVGSMNCDVIYMQERLPQKGETFFAKSASIVAGGKGANQAVQAAKLGIKTYMVAKMGADIFGELLRSELRGYGVDDTYVLTGKGMTGIAAVLTMPDGVYYSTVAPGTNMELTLDEVKVLRELICNASVVILQNEITQAVTEQVIRMAHEAGVYIVYNAAPAKAVSNECLAMVDCLVVNEIEASYYLGKTIDSVKAAKENYLRLLSKTGGTLVITLGSKGSLLCKAENCTYYPANETIKAVETTGSGDSYVGAYAFMKANGNSDEEACRLASLVSQNTVTKVGGQPSMPYWAEIEEQWEQKKRTPSPD